MILGRERSAYGDDDYLRRAVWANELFFVCDYEGFKALAEDDAHGLAIARELMQTLDWNRLCPRMPPAAYDEPLLDIEGVLSLRNLDVGVERDGLLLRFHGHRRDLTALGDG